MKLYEGKLVSKDIKIGIVAARFNEFITSKLLGGAVDALKRHDVDDDNIEVAWVFFLYFFYQIQIVYIIFLGNL